MVPRTWWWLLSALRLIKLPLIFVGCVDQVQSWAWRSNNTIEMACEAARIQENATHGAVRVELEWIETSQRGRASFALRIKGVHWTAGDGHPTAFALLVGVPPPMLLCITSVRRRARLRTMHVRRATVFGPSCRLFLIHLADLCYWLKENHHARLLSQGSIDETSCKFAAIERITQLWGTDVLGPSTASLSLYFAWGAVWWWCAVRSFRLREERDVLFALGLFWVMIAIIITTPGIMRWTLIKHLWEFI